MEIRLRLPSLLVASLESKRAYPSFWAWAAPKVSMRGLRTGSRKEPMLKKYPLAYWIPRQMAARARQNPFILLMYRKRNEVRLNNKSSIFYFINSLLVIFLNQPAIYWSQKFENFSLLLIPPAVIPKRNTLSYELLICNFELNIILFPGLAAITFAHSTGKRRVGQGSMQVGGRGTKIKNLPRGLLRLFFKQFNRITRRGGIEMHHFIMFPHSYPVISQELVDAPYAPCLKLLETVNAQASTIKQLGAEVDRLKEQVAKMSGRLQALEALPMGESQNGSENGKVRRKYFENKYSCPYPKCEKSYGSTLALNLHIKQKHNGGTKKEREAYAKIIFSCEEKGVAAPEIECDFPPGFLEEERKKYQKQG